MPREKFTIKQARRVARKLNVTLEIEARETDEYIIGGALNLAVWTQITARRAVKLAEEIIDE